MFRRAGRQSRRHPMSGAGGAFVPTQIAGLALWLRADLGVTIVQGPVVATGTTPPAVTMAGTPSSSTNTIVLTCTGAGTNTTATFIWTLNGVAQTPFTAAATVVLTGTGITATFPVGAYNNTPSADTYTSVVTVSAVADQSGSGNNCAQGTATSQPAYAATANAKGGPAIQSLYSGSPTALTGTSNLGIGTTNFTIFSVHNFTITSGNPGPLVIGAQPTGGVALINNGGRCVQAVAVGGMVDATVPASTWEKWTVQCTGGVTTLRVNGTSQTLTPNNTAFTAAPAAYSWGSAPGLGNFNGYVVSALVYAAALTASQILQVESYISAAYGV